MGLKIIIVVNKIDKPDARLSEVGDEVLELLLALAFAGLLTLSGCGDNPQEEPSSDSSTPQPGVQPVDPDADPWGLGYTARCLFLLLQSVAGRLPFSLVV